MSDNRVYGTVTDKDGMLWIATQHGLNSYDGYQVENFYSRDYPGLPSDQISRIVCDSKNRIWIQCGNGKLSLLDEQRKFRELKIEKNGKTIHVDYLLPFPDKIMFLSQGILYKLQETDSLHFTPAEMVKESLLRGTFYRINRWDKYRLVFSGKDLLFLFDMRTMKASKPIRVPFVTAVAKLGQHEAMATLKGDAKLARIDLSTGRVIKEYPRLKDQFNERIHPLPASIYHLEAQSFLITSPSAGAYIFDVRQETLKRFQHDPANDQTIASNSSLYLFSDSNGYFFITSPNSGLNYFKLNAHQAKKVLLFRDKLTNQLYDGFIGSIAEDKNGAIWLGGGKYLMKWDADAHETIFYLNEKSKILQNRGGIRTIYIDRQGRVWLGLSKGIIVLTKQGQFLRYLSGVGENALPHQTVNKIVCGPDGRLWVCTRAGICFIDPENFQIILPSENSPLTVLRNENCNTLFFPSPSEVWVGTWSGAYNFDLSAGTTTVYTTENGLLFNEVIGFANDKKGNMYIGTRRGFHILKPDNEIIAFERLNNHWPVDCYSMTKDSLGNIWFANNGFLAAYYPSTKTFKIYDERAGLNNSGFYFFAAHTADKYGLIFGANKGITYFDPEVIRNSSAPVSVVIHGLETRDSLYHFLDNSPIQLPYISNSISFTFSAVNLLSNKTVFYKYQLQGADEHWISTGTSQQVNFKKLPPGDYVFNVKASNDGLNWVTVRNPIAFQIAKPWWQSWWFIGACMFTGISLVYLIIRKRKQEMRRQQEQLEIEQAVNYLASSIYEQQTEGDILWDVAKNCIGRLQFEDCVIYLKDEKSATLKQKAAWGPKTTEGNKILNPLAIPLGMGIVGSVAQSGKPEIVGDTSNDPRYIVDDAKRFSEITVPIVYNGKILGIIDSEHSKKNFFTRQHLSILTTIASLCANKMVRLKAEKETQKAQMELLKNERKTVEAQLKSLRLQMNPHFLFNSLNSIQQMILAGEDTSATMYLSKFSRLLRLVLAHSDREMVTLKEELETLRLYVTLESLRFKGAFQFEICDNEIADPDEIRVPTMLIQPFAENAIWHGLLKKRGERCLRINFMVNEEETLVCEIEDNGIGRDATRKSNSDVQPGKGIAVAEERLKTYSNHQLQKSSVSILDLYDNDGNPAGTRVTLVLPLI